MRYPLNAEKAQGSITNKCFKKKYFQTFSRSLCITAAAASASSASAAVTFL
jgi:hypothetical protein